MSDDKWFAEDPLLHVREFVSCDSVAVGCLLCLLACVANLFKHRQECVHMSVFCFSTDQVCMGHQLHPTIDVPAYAAS